MKFIHAGLHTVAFVLAVISLVAVFDFHNYKSIPNMYSLHSWIGLMGVVLYTLQLVLGLCIFLFPMTPAFIRAAVMPIHVYSGLLIFGTVIATALMGITEKLFFALKNPAYKDSPPEAVFINTLGLLIVVFGGTVLWMVTRPSWKRPGEEASTFKQDGKVSSVTENELNLNSFDKATMESSSEAWKRNLKLEEPGLRSTIRGPLKLGMAKMTHVDFPPREVVSYTKETQTPVVTQQKEEEDEEEETAPLKPVIEPEEEKAVQKEEEEAPPHELTEEEKLQVLHSEEFLSFFDHSTRIVERALSEHVDVFFDYSGRDLEEKEGDEILNKKVQYPELLVASYNNNEDAPHEPDGVALVWNMKYKKTTPEYVFHCQYPELLVASYNNNEDAPHEPDGVALVWNMKYKKTTPEYVFHCQSAVMSAAFAKFHPNLVVGGTYSGQIVLWDNRSNKRTPVQRTPLSAAAHTHPVYCVNVVGTPNAHNLISISTDGKMCSWSLDMLSQPQDSMELVHKQSKAVAVTCMSFPLGDVNNFVVGSEEGSVYTACRHGSKAGISEIFEGHQGPITGIHCHTAAGPVDFSHLFVTSSFDWTVKLWTTKNNKPLYSFEDNSDYVYDIMWSPTHPALFACVDGVGRLDLWNLNNDTEVPTASITVEGNPALNRVRWAHSGREIAVGDSDGQILIYDVGEQISVPRNDEWTRFARTLAEINATRADAEEEAAARLSA
ncbi:UNVERIFIED_CONTAM: hypothetical protein FKN15_004216 [Acipenser sinensis]